MGLDKEEEDKLNVVQYQPYEDHEYSDISSILKHPLATNKLFLGNIFSATDKLILDFYKINVVISIVDDDKLDIALLKSQNIKHILFKAEDKEDNDVA